jgi:hypothetical protein
MRQGLWLVLAGGVLMGACRDKEPIRVVAGGDPAAGKHLIKRYGCGSCHVVPGVTGANGMVGPPLEYFSRRAYIAGEVPNDPEFLILSMLSSDFELPVLGSRQGATQTASIDWVKVWEADT